MKTRELLIRLFGAVALIVVLIPISSSSVFVFSALDARSTAKLVAALWLGVAVFQFALVAGAPLGEFTQGGQHPGRLPRNQRLTALMSGLLMLLFAAGTLGLFGVGPLANGAYLLTHSVTFIACVFSGFGIVANGISRSIRETIIWVPVTALGYYLSLELLTWPVAV